MAKKSNVITLCLLCIAAPIIAVGGYFLLGSKQFYISAVMIAVLALIPFFISFEKRRISVRETAVLAALTAIAVASRAVFYAAPQIKPVAAIVIVAGVSFGYEVGFFVGSMSMLLSNIIFGQGMWTPFQMLAMGLVGLICALLFRIKKINGSRILSALTGGFVTFFVYGAIVDLSSVFMLVSDFNVKSIISVYSTGIVMNAVFAAVTAMFIFFFGKSFSDKLARLKIKYGIFRKINE